MKNQKDRNLLITLMIGWAIVLAWCDILIVSLLVGAVASLFIWKPEIELFGDEEETNEEES